MNAIEFIKQHNNDFREGYKTTVLSLHDVEQLLIKWNERQSIKTNKTESDRRNYKHWREREKRVQEI